MQDTADPSSAFECATCGRRYPWKAEWAGRKVRCKCGETIVCPAEPEEDLYSVVPVTKPVKTAVRTVAVKDNGTALSGASGTSTGAKPQAPVRRAGETEPLSDRAINVHIPLAILCVGVLVEIVGALLAGESIRHAIGMLIVRLTLAPAVMMFGIFIAANFRGIDFGDFPTAALKLAAICIGSSAAATLMLPLGQVLGFLGGLVALGVQFVLYFALLGMMFNLDESDTWYCVMVFFVIDVALYFAMQYAMSFR